MAWYVGATAPSCRAPELVSGGKYAGMGRTRHEGSGCVPPIGSASIPSGCPMTSSRAEQGTTNVIGPPRPPGAALMTSSAERNQELGVVVRG